MSLRVVVLIVVIVSVVSSAMTLSIVGLVTATGAQAAPAIQATLPVIRASRFELVDARGTVRGVWDVNESGVVGLAMLDATRRGGVALGVADDGGGLVITDTAGLTRATVGWDSTRDEARVESKT